MRNSYAYIFLIPTFSLKKEGADTCADTYGPRVSLKKVWREYIAVN